MPRIRVHYACDQCGHQSSAEYFDYRYHETEVVRALCGGCGYMTEHTPQSASRVKDQIQRPSSSDIDVTENRSPSLETWRKFYQHGFTCWKCSRCGTTKQSLEAPAPCDCNI